MTEQTSASDRYEAARKALAAAAMYGVSPGMSAQREAQMVLDLVEALRAFVTPPTGNHVPQTSASDRYEAARKALSAWTDADRDDRETEEAVVEALRALITPPGVGEDVGQIAANIERVYGGRLPQTTLLQMAVRAGIQSAHETWEPEVAQRPSQEQMLRWLGLRFGDAGRPTHIHIPFQNIEREEA